MYCQNYGARHDILLAKVFIFILARTRVFTAFFAMRSVSMTIILDLITGEVCTLLHVHKLTLEQRSTRTNVELENLYLHAIERLPEVELVYR